MFLKRGLPSFAYVLVTRLIALSRLVLGPE